MVRNTCVQCYRPRSLTILIYSSEFNHVKNSADQCVLVPGTTPLPDDDSCKDDEEYWYERTAYRLIPYSSCAGGKRLDRGAEHQCPGFKAHGTFFWLFVLLIPFGFTALVGYYYYRRSGLARGYVFSFFLLENALLICFRPEQFVFQEMQDRRTAVIQAFWTLWPPCHGSSLALLVSHGSGSFHT